MGCSHVAAGHWVGVAVLVTGLLLVLAGVASPAWRTLDRQGFTLYEGLWQLCDSRHLRATPPAPKCIFSQRNSGLWRALQVLKLVSLLVLMTSLVTSLVYGCGRRRRKRCGRAPMLGEPGKYPVTCCCAALGGGVMSLVADLLYVGVMERHALHVPGQVTYSWSFALSVAGSALCLCSALTFYLSARYCLPRYCSQSAQPYRPYRHYSVHSDQYGCPRYFPTLPDSSGAKGLGSDTYSFGPGSWQPRGLHGKGPYTVSQDMRQLEPYPGATLLYPDAGHRRRQFGKNRNGDTFQEELPPQVYIYPSELAVRNGILHERNKTREQDKSRKRDKTDIMSSHYQDADFDKTLKNVAEVHSEQGDLDPKMNETVVYSPRGQAAVVSQEQTDSGRESTEPRSPSSTSPSHPPSLTNEASPSSGVEADGEREPSSQRGVKRVTIAEDSKREKHGPGREVGRPRSLFWDYGAQDPDQRHPRAHFLTQPHPLYRSRSHEDWEREEMIQHRRQPATSRTPPSPRPPRNKVTFRQRSRSLEDLRQGEPAFKRGLLPRIYLHESTYPEHQARLDPYPVYPIRPGDPHRHTWFVYQPGHARDKLKKTRRGHFQL